MITTAIFPNRYVQGDKALDVLGEEAARLGNHALVLLDPFVHSQYADRISRILTGVMNFTITLFNGECCDEEVERIRHLTRDSSARVIVGIGGGKVLDTAKAIALLKQSLTLLPNNE